MARRPLNVQQRDRHTFTNDEGWWVRLTLHVQAEKSRSECEQQCSYTPGRPTVLNSWALRIEARG